MCCQSRSFDYLHIFIGFDVNVWILLHHLYLEYLLFFLEETLPPPLLGMGNGLLLQVGNDVLGALEVR